MKTLLALILGLALAGPALAQTPPVQDAQDDGTVEGVVVTAPQKEMIEAFVADVSEAAVGRDQLGRWDRKICPGVTGLNPRYARFFNDRLAMAAFGVGLDVGEPGCRANILIVMTDDGRRTAREIVRHNGRWMDKHNDEGTRGRRALKEFTESTRPIRWWHVTHTVAEDGTPIIHDPEGPQQITVRGTGRLHKGTTQNFHRMVIVVDFKAAGPVPLGALADYVAMVALAQFDPKADTSRYPTILNLFADRARGREAASGLTSWDKSYLAGLYGARREAPNVRTQQRDITREMRRGGK